MIRLVAPNQASRVGLQVATERTARKDPRHSGRMSEHHRPHQAIPDGLTATSRGRHHRCVRLKPGRRVPGWSSRCYSDVALTGRSGAFEQSESYRARVDGPLPRWRVSRWRAGGADTWRQEDQLASGALAWSITALRAVHDRLALLVWRWCLWPDTISSREG